MHGQRSSGLAQLGVRGLGLHDLIEGSILWGASKSAGLLGMMAHGCVVCV